MGVISTDKYKKATCRRVANAIAKMDFRLKPGDGTAISTPGPRKMGGIGAVSGKQIEEFLKTGKIEELEELRVNLFRLAQNCIFFFH